MSDHRINCPSGYLRHAVEQRNLELLCNRTKRDAFLMPEIRRVWEQNLKVYGADKVWRQLHRESEAVASCAVERLMRRLGIQDMRRGKAERTTIADTAAPCSLDHVNRQFKADRSNQLCVSDFTYVSAWQGWLYVAFVIDVFARLWAGASAVPCIPTSCSMSWNRRCMTVDRHKTRA